MNDLIRTFKFRLRFVDSRGFGDMFENCFTYLKYYLFCCLVAFCSNLFLLLGHACYNTFMYGFSVFSMFKHVILVKLLIVSVMKLYNGFLDAACPKSSSCGVLLCLRMNSKLLLYAITENFVIN